MTGLTTPFRDARRAMLRTPPGACTRNCPFRVLCDAASGPRATTPAADAGDPTVDGIVTDPRAEGIDPFVARINVSARRQDWRSANVHEPDGHAMDDGRHATNRDPQSSRRRLRLSAYLRLQGPQSANARTR
jgi:hypothetical protein